MHLATSIEALRAHNTHLAGSMSKPKVYMLDPYHRDAVALLQSQSHIQSILPTDPKKATWHEDATAIVIRSDSRISADDIARAKQLKMIVKQGVGVDNVDLTAAKEHRVAVYNTPALNSETVAELVLAATLSIARRLPEYDRKLRAGEKIVRSQMLGISLFKKTIGIIGMGNIGKIVAEKFIGCANASIIGYDPVAPPNVWEGIPHKRVHNLDELLEQSDVVTLHVPLIDSTKGMIGSAQLDKMRDQAILVNAARGGVVDEPALLDTLKKGRLWGVVLDACETEPPTKEVYGELLEYGNVLITPHIGASTQENQSNSGTAVIRILLAVLNGEQDVQGKVV